MAAGLRIENSDGTIQIDENYKNFVLVAKGSVTVSSSSDYNSMREGSISRTGTTVPIIAVAHSSPFFTVVQRNSSGALTAKIVTAASSGTSIPYYIFDEAPNTASSFGLLIRNAANQVIFSSDMRPLRIVDVINSSNFANTVTRNYTSGRTYACAIGKRGFSYENPLGYPTVRPLYTTGVTISGRTVECARMVAANLPITGSVNSPFQSIMVVDVTNY